MMEKITRQEASPATAPTRRSTLNQRLRHQALALAVTMALGLPQVQAQAVPDGSTSTSTQTAANGVPVVNIAAPNKAGLSHNTYAQFDVGKQGLILNNSGTLSATQLAGYVTGNPNLSAGQSATLILNEVTSTRASQLAGAMEVAGTPAEVVVANPNGISCTGCGFINTPHAVLTTGRPVFGQDGGLSGFRVTGGTLSVSGEGLDGSLVDQVDLIARAVSINAGVWAKHLNVITGANQVDAASLAAQPIAGTGSTPVVALDVSALGGMYAGVIRLIGTEAGLGVNSQGQIAAQNGSLSLSSAGDVVLGGKTVATGDLSLQSSGAIEQSGTLASGGALSLIAAGSLGNHGLIQAQGGTITLQAGGALSNAADGSVQGNGALQLRAASLDNAGKLYALGGEWKATLGGAAVNHTSGDIYASQGITLSAASLGNDGAIEATTDAALAVSGALANAGHVQADQGDVTLHAGSLDNRGAVSAQHALGMQVSALAQNSGTLVAGGTVGITATQFSNTASGQLQSGTDLTVSTATLDNAGNLYAKGNAVLNGGGLSNAAAAQLIADGSLVVNDTGDIVNAGLLQAGTDLRLQHAASLSNATDATIYAGGSFTLGLVQALDNHGLMYGAHAFGLTVGSADNEGTLRSGGDLSLDSAGELQNTGAIQAQQNLHLGGNAFTNAGKLYAIDGDLDGHVAGAFASTSTGDIYSGSHIALTLGSFSHAGVLEAGTGATINSQDTSDNTGTIQVDQGDLGATAAQLSNEGAFSAAGNLSLTGSSRLDNRGQIVAGQALTLASADASNSGQTQSGAGTTLAIASFANSGRVQAGTDLTIRGNHDLTNASTGQLLAAGDLGADTSVLLDNAGVLQAGGKLAVLGAGAIRNESTGMLYGTALATLHLGGALDNAGTVYGAQDLDLAVLGLDNDGSLRSDAALDASVQGDAHSTGTAYAAGKAQWNVTGALFDTGTLAGGGDVDISAASLDGDGTLAAGLSGDGTLGATGNLHVITTAGLSVHGRALAGGDLVLDGSAIDLSGSQVRAGSDATLTASQGDVSNQGGDLAANGRLTLTAAGALLNGGDTVALGGHLTAQTLALQATRLDNRYGSLLQSGSDDLSLSFAGAFANAHGTLAANAGNLSISAASLDNDSGVIQHAGTGLLTLSATGALTNAGGSIAGNGAATIHAGGALDDTGGTLGLAGDLQLDADALDNSDGSLVADHVTLTLGHALTNTGGTLQSTHAMTVHAGSLANTGGFVKVTGTGEALTLVASGALANAASSGAGGFIGGNGDVSIQAASLANTAQIYAGRALDVGTTQGALVNDGGALQAMSSMQLASAGALSNRSGTIEAGAGDAAATLTLHAGSLDNTGGRIADSGTGITTLGVGGNLINQGGTLGGQGAVTLTAASLSNTQGAHLVAGDELDLTLGGLDNSAGTIYAAGDIDWSNSGASLLNTSGNLGAGGTLALVIGSVGNSAGALAATGDVTLQFSSLSGNGRVVAGRDLSLTLPGGFTNGVGNTLKANRDLSLHLGGDFANAGGALLSAVRNLSVTAANIDNAAGAQIEASGTSLTASGNLTNEGRIEGDDITLKAGTFTNADTVIGGAIDITATTLTNGIDLGTATDNAAYQTALIAATDGIDLWVQGTLLNRDATIFTLGDLRISADSSGTRSQAVINRSGDIEADGNVRIDAEQFTNQRRVFQTITYDLTTTEQAQNTTIGAPVARYLSTDTDPLHQPPNVTPDQVIGSSEFALASAYCDFHNGSDSRCVGYPQGVGAPVAFQSTTTYTVTSVTRLQAASAQGKLLAGGNITLNGSVLNDKSTIAAGNNLIINGQDGSNGGGSTSTATVQNVAWVPTALVAMDTQDQTLSQYLVHNPRRWVDGDWWTYGTSTGQQQISLAPGAVPSWITYNAGSGLAASMTAGNTVSITAQTINNTAVGADGQPVHAVIGLGQNAGAQSVNGSGSGTVGSVQGSHGGFTTVGLGDAPTSAAGGSLDQAPPRSGTSGGNAQPASPQVVSALGGAHPTVSLPQLGIYTVHTSPSSPYLVETDPRFTDYAQFISSDYMTGKLGIDPAAVGKRLGDGFYEEHAVLDQITSLTGRRFLSDDTDALSQYRSLMDAGVQVAQRFDLSVGVALTPEQMANLTQDMVWLVDATVDGQQVLVPVVYLSAEHARTLAAGGATIAGSTVVLNASGDITNNGAIKASQDAQLKAANLLNSGTLSAGGSLSISAAQDILNGGTINAGGNVSLVAGNDVRSGLAVATVLGAMNLSDLGAPVSSVALGNLNQPGSIHAGGNLAISAGRDLSLDAAPVAAGGNLALAAGRDLTATATAISAGGDAQLLAGRDLSLLATGHTVRQGTLSHGVETTTHTVSTIDAGGSLLVAAGRDLSSQAASLTAGNQLGVSAGRDLNLSAVTDTQTQTSYTLQGRTQITTTQRDESVRGATLSGANGVMVSAGHDLSATAATIASTQGNVVLAAGNDLTLSAGQETHSTSTDTYTKKHGLLSSQTTTTHDASSDTYAIGTTVSGDNVVLSAGHDLTTQAAQVAGTHDVLLAAGNALTIGTAEDIHTESHSIKQKKSGLSAGGGASGLGGIGFTAGSQRMNASSTVEQHTTSGSLIGSTQGNVALVAGGDLAVIGSDLIANRATGSDNGGNIALQGKNITITSATQTDHETSSQQSSSHGFSAALVGTPLDGLRNVQQTTHESAGSGKRAQDTLNAIGAMGGDTPGIAIGYGSSHANQSSQYDSTTERGSTLHAAGDLTLNANGGDLTVVGSALSAGGTATLEALHNVTLLTSVDTQSQSSQSSNHSKSLTAAPASWGDLARHLQGGPNHSGVSMSGYNGQSGHASSSQQVVNETGTTVDAGQINVISQQGDITTQGAQLTAQHDLNVLAAQGNIDLGTGEASRIWQDQQNGHQLGDLGGDGYAGTVGKRTQLHDQSGQQTLQSTLRTELTSAQGDVNVIAHGDLVGQGVDIAGRDVTLMGRNVALTPSVDTLEEQQRDKVSQFGVTVALSGAAAQAAQAADSAVAAHDQGDNRLSALYAAEAAYGTKDSVAAAHGQGSNSLMKVTVSIGGGHQSSATSYQSQTQQGSTITASRDVTIVATGSGTQGADGYAADGDILMEGAQVQAGRNASLVAARDIDLLSSEDTTSQSSQNHSSNASVGVGFALGGEQNGFTLELAAAAGKGQGNGDSTVHHVTSIGAGDTLSLISGRDTTLEGAQATGQTILADVGRNLTLTSTQDSQHYVEKDQNASAGVSLCIPPFCYGSSSGGASYNQTDIHNQYQSVTDQTGLVAGSGGFDIHVGGTTALTGAALASTADASRNLLDTGNLTVTSLHNFSDSSASQVGASFNTAGSLGSNLLNNGVGAVPSLAVPQGSHQSSDTVSSIAPGTIIVRNDPTQDLSGIDRSATLDGHGVSNDFNLDQIKENQALGQAAGYVGMRAAGDLESDLNLNTGSAGSIAIHTVVGGAAAALGGGNAAQGALGAGVSEAVSTSLANTLANQGIDPNGSLGVSLLNVGSALLGAAAGGGAGASTALAGEQYNRQLHPSEQQLAQTLAANSNGQYTVQQIEDAMRISGYTSTSGSSIPAETTQTGMLVDVTNSRSIYDVNASWLLIPGPNGTQDLMQQMPAQISAGLASYIISNTGGASSPYAWTSEQEGLPTPQEPYIPYLAVIPDYAIVNGTGFGAGGSVALNLHTGQIYVGGSGSVPVSPGGSFAIGYLPANLGENSSAAGINTANLLTGAGINGTACYLLCLGANHSYGGDTAIEVGAGIGAPAKGGSGSTGVMKPLFSLPFTNGDKPPSH